VVAEALSYEGEREPRAPSTHDFSGISPEPERGA